MNAPNEFDLAAGEAPQGADPFDVAAKETLDAQRTALRSSLYGSLLSNPDMAARAVKLGRRAGLPPSVVQRNLPEVERSVQLNDFDRTLRESPQLAQFLTDPDNASVSHDDVDNLGLIETLANSFRRGVPALRSMLPTLRVIDQASGLAQLDAIDRGEKLDAAQLGVIAAQYAAMLPDQRAALRARITPNMQANVGEAAADLASLQTERNAIPLPGVVGRTMQAKTFGEAFSSIAESPLRFIAGIGPESLVQSAPGMLAAIPAAISAGPLGAAGTMGANSFLVDYASSLVEALQSAGVDTSNPEAIRTATRDPALLTKIISEAARHAAVVGAFDTVSGAVAGKMLLPRQVAGKLTGRPLAAEFANIGAQVPIQAALGAAGEAGGELAAGQELQPGQILAEAFGEFFGTPAEVVTVSAKRFHGRVSEAQQARADAQRLQQLTEAAAASKVRARDPETFSRFVEAASAQSPLQEVFVDADTLAQSAGPNLETLKAQIPDLAEQLEEASAAGGDVRISVADFATHVAGSEFAAQLLPHLRTAPDAMTLAEADTFAQQGTEDLRAEVEQAAGASPVDQTEQVDPVAAVREGIAAQLDQANRFTPDVNQAYTELLTSFAVASADRAGVPLQQFVEQFGPRIVSQLDPSRAPGMFDSQAPEPLPATGAPLDAVMGPDGTPDPAVLDQAAGGRRGAYDPASRTIALLERADLSTFVHEAGHYFLEVQAELAGRENAPPQIQADMQTLLAWFGVPDLVTWQGMSLEQRRASHEQFARGFEAYAMEGEAPSPELQGVFRRFRSWLLRVYRSLSALQVTLSDDVRGVMGRLLASDAAIADAQAARSYVPLFESAEAAGMSAEDWAGYQQLGKRATETAVEQLQTRSLRDMQWLTNAKTRKLRELQRAAGEKRKAIEAEVRTEVEGLPIYRAERLLRTGKLEDEQLGTKLSREALVTAYGDGPDALWRRLPAHFLTNNPDNGIHPDVLADGLGMSSGDQLVQQLVTVDAAQVVIEAETDQRMLERYGDLVDRQSIERAAEAAIHNDVRARVLERETNALQKAVGNRPLLVRAAREFAEASVARKRVRDVRPSQYSAAEARAGREATKAFKAGDTVTAAAAKRAQLLNNQLARVAGRALTETEKAIDYLRRFDSAATRQAIGAEYADQIDALLERYDLRTSQSLKAIDKRKSLAAWVEAQRELGFEPVIADSLLEEAARQSYRDLRIEEMRGLVDAVRNIEHLGRLKQKLLTVQDQRQFDAIVTEAANSIRDNATKTLAEKIESDLPRDRAGKLVTQFLVSHRKLASLVRQMDGGKDGGALWSILVANMNRAGNTETTMRADATAKLSALFEPVNKAGDLYRKAFIPEIRGSLTRAGRLAVALNWGNADNRQRILDGERWSQSQAQAVLDTLTKEDWNFVQGVWDFVDSYWPAIKAKEERVSGIAPEKVQASPVATPFGEYRGGYYPIKYDADRSTKAGADSLAEAVKQSMQGLYTRATTRRGHTKARVESVARPVSKDLGVVFQHVEQVTHDLAWHEFLIDANRLLRAKPIDAAIREHYGPEVLRTMSAALTDIAAGDIPANGAWEQMLQHLRAGVSIAAMGWSLVTAAQQPLGLSQAMVRIGPKWVGRGLAQWLGDAARMENTVAGIHARSEFMRLRDQTQNREIADIRNRVRDAGEWKVIPPAVRESFFYFTQKMQLVADVPTWLGQYTKSIEAGETEARAVELADQAVIDSQSSGHIKDLAAIQRGSPALKLFTAFYSAFSATFNLTAESIARTRFSDPASVGRLAVDMLLLYTLPAVLGMLLKDAMRGDLEDDPEKLATKLAREQLNYIASVMIGVRELSAAISGQFGYSGPAGTRLFSDLARFSKQAQQGEADEALAKAANSSAGVLFHYPALQVERTVAGIRAVNEGTAGPSAILFGPPKRKE